MISSTDSGTPRILVIDDNPSIHRDFGLVLLGGDEANPELEADEQLLYGPKAPPNRLRPRYQLEHALSGLEGIEKIRQSVAADFPYQLAFVDIRMPGIDGVETIQRLWQLDPRVQIVICTAYADYSWEDLVRRLGWTDKLLILKKPFDNIEVTLLASTLVEKWHLARQAALKIEQMELLVARRTQRVLELQQLPNACSETSPRAAPEEPEGNRELPLVLLIETDLELDHNLKEALETDCQVLTAPDSEQGFRLTREALPDLVIAEMLPPPFNGVELCRRLKADELASHIPVILLAASGDEEARIKALEAGAASWIGKPFPPPLLKARVEELLTSSQRPSPITANGASLGFRDLRANQLEAQFLRRAVEIVERHLSDYEFDVEALAQKLAMSRRQLFRKFKVATGNTPNLFIRDLRLKRAAQLLAKPGMTITEVTYAVGFSDLKHFRALFRERFGVLPGEYAKRANLDFGTIPPPVWHD